MQSKRMGRDGPYAHKLHAPQAFARFRGARLAHEVLCFSACPNSFFCIYSHHAIRFSWQIEVLLAYPVEMAL
ncbi:hypothetical protein [uncultured Intestinimonas sp.]|uniref:hypothetical protein n=1 Tax=uncultured Intestinimonas sp. TaxID=1689265 RepID=UPI002943EB52|nr:hypothetical protein [uncultured Intestinimonas sp.]